jgi:hypothetical protein
LGVKVWGAGGGHTARDRDDWKLILKETKVLHGLYSQWEQREREREREPHKKEKKRWLMRFFYTFVPCIFIICIMNQQMHN